MKEIMVVSYGIVEFFKPETVERKSKIQLNNLALRVFPDRRFPDRCFPNLYTKRTYPDYRENSKISRQLRIQMKTNKFNFYSN